ncbi:hypothetical protein [Halorubrum halophilum]|uniref:hypothetical protein n=1 Tax=Halorubrum halophilum TaxID=413816 RepID=UPI00186B3781|nr:hypothetical protein [Halorubrum halophilum]
MTDDRITVQNIHLGCHYTPESEMDYAEFFSDLYDYTPSAPFINKVTEGSPSEPLDCTVAFGRSGEGNPLETSTNYVRIELVDTGEESDPELSVHSDFWHTLVPDVAEILHNVGSMAGGMSFNIFSMSMELEESLSEIVDANPELPDGFEDYDLTGFRFDYYKQDDLGNEIDILLQKYSDEEPDKTTARFARDSSQLDPDEAKDFIMSQNDVLIETSEELLP